MAFLYLHCFVVWLCTASLEVVGKSMSILPKLFLWSALVSRTRQKSSYITYKLHLQEAFYSPVFLTPCLYQHINSALTSEDRKLQEESQALQQLQKQKCWQRLSGTQPRPELPNRALSSLPKFRITNELNIFFISHHRDLIILCSKR